MAGESSGMEEESSAYGQLLRSRYGAGGLSYGKIASAETEKKN